MSKTNIIAAGMAVIAISAICLIGCASSEYTDSSTTDETKEVGFSWWGNDDRHRYTIDGLEIFEENNADIVVKKRYGEWSGYEKKNRVWMKSCQEADVMQINYAWLSSYSPDGEGYYDLYELTDYIDLSGYDESDLKYGEMNGKLNGIPIAFNASTICYNYDLFEKYGLEIPESFDDWFAAAKVMREDDVYVMGMAKKHVYLLLISYFEQTTGRHVFSENGDFLLDKDDIEYLLDFYKALIDEKVLIPIDQFERNGFGQAKFAGSIFWISDAENYCSVLEDNGYTAYIANYPQALEPKLSGKYMKPATMYAISNITEAPEDAARLLNFLINGEEMVILQGNEKGVPANKNARDILEDNDLAGGYGYNAYLKLEEDKAHMNIMIPEMESEDAIQVIKEDSDAYLYDVATKEETVNKIYEDLRKIFGE